MSTILRGTTPALRIGIDQNDFLVSDVVTLEIKIWQDSEVNQLDYDLESVTVDTENNAFEIKFTEEQTLAFVASKPLYWQMRCKFADGSIVGTAVSAPISIARLKSRTVLTE